MLRIIEMGNVNVIRKFKFFEEKDLTHSFDPLTKVLNRETMIAYVNNLINNNKPFSFFLVDVDNFKNVNDNYGHLVGDTVLVHTAAYICDKVGDKGVVGRYGGDEFMIVFEGIVEYKEVWNAGHNINCDIGSLKFDGVAGLHITITMGVSRFPVNAKTYVDILKLADKALYRGKTKGRNCFIIYLEEKHKNLTIRKDKGNNYSSMYLCSRVFAYLTATDDLQKNISYLFKRVVGYYMFDHIGIESKNKLNFETIHSLARTKQFEHIPYDVILRATNNQGLVNIGKIDTLDETVYGSFISALKKQNVSSAVYCKIAAFGKDYGFIRVDMTSNVRMWQSGEMDIIVIAANTLGLMLHYQNKTLDDLDIVQPEIVETNINLD
jgi:diguanylate cyclase (GGDEF)-like protein